MSEEKTQKELEVDIAELRVRKQAAASENMALQARLSELNHALKTTLPRQKFEVLDREREETKQMLARKINEITELKNQIQLLSVTREISKMVVW